MTRPVASCACARTGSRVPEIWWGDYLASLGAVRIAERELLALGEEVGWDTLEGYAESWFDYSETKMVEAIQKLKSGRPDHTPGARSLPRRSGRYSPVKVDVAIDAEAGNRSPLTCATIPIVNRAG